KQRTKRNILHRVHFQEGSLPVTYLGLPLITKRLSKVDCSPLVERMLAKVNSWVSKALSLAGRLQLVKATLTSMQTFWCSSFLLPMSTIRECEKVLRDFLWGGPRKAKVKWKEVCKPLHEGGLGIKDMKTWNKALLLRQLWHFWNAPLRGILSWSWRQLLKLRPMAREHLIYQCGNGERFSLWFDPWVQGESVHALYGHRVIYDSGLGVMARVKDIIDGEWAWPQVSGDLIELQLRTQGIPISNAPDRIFWDQVGVSFSTSKAWQGIRKGSSLVDWHNLVWHPRYIPKHAFCLWLTLRRAHRTRDKLVAMGVTHHTSCLFNCGEPETLDHLFF
ncbi:LOW QUALITY PROTEIN: zf-RVT domain-containing protein, partial [Cephalotus follicularis]